MARVTFYEKPGCINNTRQKQLLREAGHQVEARNLLTEAWTPERLATFFDALPLAQWFNRSAPLISSGALIPEKLDREQALALMAVQPLLIRRPLMQVGEERRVGFEVESVDAWIGLRSSPNDDLEGCPRQGHGACD